MFSRILLREYGRLGLNYYPTTLKEEIKKETKDFSEFLHTIATKEREQDVNLTFEGKTINVKVILVAKSFVIYRAGIAPYIKRIENSLDGESILYILAIGINTQFVKKIKKYLKVNFSDKYDIYSETYSNYFKKSKSRKDFINVIAVPKDKSVIP